MTKISKYISLAEATKSQTAVRLGINNMPSDIELSNMQTVANCLFDKVRIYIGSPLYVSSFFRCEALNKAIGGAAKSQHRTGEAIDIDADVYGVQQNGKALDYPNQYVFDFIREGMVFDQLIWEFGSTHNPDWVHVSLKRSGNRHQVLRAYRDENGRTRYVPFDLY